MFNIETNVNILLMQGPGINGLALLGDITLLYTDSSKHQVLQLDIATKEVQTVAGCGREGSRDGSDVSCLISQPYGICVEGKTIYVTDPSSGRVIMISPASATSIFLQALGNLYDAFDIHVKHGELSNITLQQTEEKLSQTVAFISDHVANAKEVQNLTQGTLNGPQGTISAKTQKSVSLLHNGIQTLLSKLEGYNYNVTVSTLLTCVVENLHAVSHMKHETFTSIIAETLAV
jgi:hypothetical protein